MLDGLTLRASWPIRMREVYLDGPRRLFTREDRGQSLIGSIAESYISSHDIPHVTCTSLFGLRSFICGSCLKSFGVGGIAARSILFFVNTLIHYPPDTRFILRRL